MIKPDYQGGGLVNLMQSLRSVLIPHSGTKYPELQGLDTGLLRSAQHILLIVIDGLGEQVLWRFPGSQLARERRQVLTSVFPTTTATAITTLMTGQAAQQHAITGWYMWLREAGVVSTILPFITRAGGVDLRKLGLDVEQVIGCRSLFAEVERTCRAYLPEQIVNSVYSTTLTGPAARVGYSSLDALAGRLQQDLSQQREPSIAWVYWPELDSTMHHQGVTGEATKSVFARLDAWWQRVTAALAGTDTLMLVTADHGHIDTGESRHVRLENHPDLQRCLTLPLCGEPRAAYCYVRPQAQKRFESYVATALADYCTLLPAADLMEQGFFGIGEPHPELSSRIGDYVLLMKDNYVIKDTLCSEKAFTFAGVHSGLSREEMEVPLIVKGV